MERESVLLEDWRFCICCSHVGLMAVHSLFTSWCPFTVRTIKYSWKILCIPTCDCFFFMPCTHQRGSFASCLLIVPFSLQSIFSFLSLRRRKPSIAFGSLWSILFYCGRLGDGWWLVILLNTRSLISYSWSEFCLLWKCDVSTPLLMRLTKSTCWELFSCLVFSEGQICGGHVFHMKAIETNQRKTEKLPSPVLTFFACEIKIHEATENKSFISLQSTRLQMKIPPSILLETGD